MQRLGFMERGAPPIPLGLIFLGAFLIHAPLLLMKLPLKSYDTNFHIFFASHYSHHWFDPWNAKWYAGFSQTTYPPLPQQWVAIVSRLIGLDMAYMLVQFAAIVLLTLGVYRFSKLWVGARAAGYAALASILLGSEAFLVYSAGQLSTTFAAPLYLNSLPYLYEWMRWRNWRSLLKGSALAVAAAAAHHATLLFGSFLFAIPIVALAIIDVRESRLAHVGSFIIRTIFVTALVGTMIAVVLLPFWIALINYPVTQVPIPHPSRSNYILNPQWGVNFFLVPYGAMILALPFIFMRGSSSPRLRPLLLGFWVAFLLGLGGTTPVARMLLGRAFEVLTMERFAYWATLLALPFIGLLAEELIDRYKWRAVAGLTLSSASKSTLRPSTPPDALTSSIASVVARRPYCPSWPRKPVRGVRWPIFMVSACALTIAGKPSDPAAAATPIAAVFLRASRRVIDVGDGGEARVLRDLCVDMRPPPGWNPDLALCCGGLRVNGRSDERPDA